jgi:hypothetical protein
MSGHGGETSAKRVPAQSDRSISSISISSPRIFLLGPDHLVSEVLERLDVRLELVVVINHVPAIALVVGEKCRDDSLDWTGAVVRWSRSSQVVRPAGHAWLSHGSPFPVIEVLLRHVESLKYRLGRRRLLLGDVQPRAGLLFTGDPGSHAAHRFGQVVIGHSSGAMLADTSRCFTAMPQLCDVCPLGSGAALISSMW